MATFSGGNGSQTINGTAFADVMYGHSAGDTNPNTGLIAAATAATGLSSAIFGGTTGADPNALYMLEKDEGRVVRVDLETQTRSTFLDIPNTDFAGGGERGLLGMAFHPDYASNGRFFVFATAPNGDLRVIEYTNGGGTPPVANGSSAEIIITIPHSTNSNHNGGSLAFGPDGYLYVSTGDGGGGNDPEGNGQNINTLLGKILRLDVDATPAAGKNYAIPASNPFVGTAGADEIWDYGLRNPWRISFDSATGDLWIGDVGQGAREEIDVHRAGTPGGLNFGWNVREGDLPGPGSGSGPFVDPIHSYDRNDGRSVTGGFVYRGPDSGLQGAYVFADFATDKIWALVPKPGGTVERVDLTPRIVSDQAISLISSFGLDTNGELYVVSLGGTVYRLDLSSGAGDGNDVLNGGGGNDSIYGGQGNDRLNGGTGGDRISGGLGNDVISGGADNDILLGDAGADVILGDAGTDVLNGGAGADDMRGGAGNDTYVVDNAGDRANNEIAGGGIDVIQTSVSFTIAAGVERLILTGTGAISGTGSNTQNDMIVGNNANNALRGLGGNDSLNGLGGADGINGGAGNDMLNGGLGNDTLLGDAGQDRFMFGTALNSATNRDTILDFTAADDQIVLENAIFTALAPGALLPAQFKDFAAGPADASDRILYNSGTGAVFYDADGAGGSAAILFAVLTGAPALTAADFTIF